MIPANCVIAEHVQSLHYVCSLDGRRCEYILKTSYISKTPLFKAHEIIGTNVSGADPQRAIVSHRRVCDYALCSDMAANPTRFWSRTRSAYLDSATNAAKRTRSTWLATTQDTWMLWSRSQTMIITTTGIGLCTPDFSENIRVTVGWSVSIHSTQRQ